MAELVKVAVDAMGGDNAPVEIVKGAVEAINESSHVKVFLVGQEDVVNAELAKYTYNKEQMEVVNATEIIETAEPPVMAIRKKKDSSLVKALYLVKDGTCDAYVSAGSTGRSGDRRQNKRCGASSACSFDSHGEGLFPFDRLRSECGCKAISSDPVCQDGFHLYGTCYECKES